ncbi:Bub1, partial [Operophtera brumata]
MAYCMDNLSFSTPVPLCVYVGETEYSLEEIRSRKYNLERKAKPENQENIVQQHYTSINETLAQCSALETLANCALDPEQDHLGQLMPLAIPTLQNITKVSNMHSPGEPKVLCNLDSKEFSELSSKKSDENQTSHVDKENLVHQLTPVNYGNENNPENYGKNNLMEEFNRSLMGNLLGDSRKQELANMANVGQDKENANKFNPVASQPQQNVNKTAYYEEPSCTQVFNFNIKDASTPNMSQFKKPSSNIDQSKYSSVPKFSIDESGIEHVDPALGKREENSRQQGADQHATDNQGGGLSSTRTNFTGYTTNYDSMYNHNDPSQATSSKRCSMPNQLRHHNGQFARVQSKRETPENKPQPNSAPYPLHDHQYQKPTTQSYNGYSPQRPVHPHYQQNYNYQYPNNNQMMAQQQQGYASPNPSAYHSPQHPGMQSPHAISPSVQPAFGSPTYTNQVGYQSPGQPIMSPQQGYAGRQEYHYPNQQERQHIYANQQQQPAVFQSPPHQTHPYSRQSAKPMPEASAAYGGANNQPFQIYQSPQASQNNSYVATNNVSQMANAPSEATPEMHARQDPHANVSVKHDTPEQNVARASLAKNAAHKSPTAALRNIRHDQPNVKIGQNSPDIGFSNQFLNFISNRNEPKDNANTPKFTNSPTISQKMHKNLYVSSPEQAQIPPSSGMSDSDSKDGMTAQSNTPIQSAKISHNVAEKHKDLSKRQLDFEHRMELQSEDSRDSVSKECRIPSIYSRQSDGYGMDVDSENSMECAAFKSSHSISMLETSDIPRPADIDFPKQIDPFSRKLLNSLLEYVKFPNKTHADGYNEVRSVPKLQLATNVSVGGNRFAVEKQLGKGNYGAVFLCLDLHSNKSVAAKYQKPSRPWEFYICQEIKARIKDPFMFPGYMDIETAFIGENASLFVSEYSKYGSLLDVANKIRAATSKCINEFIVILLTSEMLSIIHYLHKAQIIHADIKPDNFLLMKIPTQEWRTPSLQLIDLGCAIDIEGKPWTFQTDLYCLAGTIHVILMGSYMKVANRLGQWNIDKKLP